MNSGDNHYYIEVEIYDSELEKPAYDGGPHEPPRSKGFESIEEYDRLMDTDAQN